MGELLVGALESGAAAWCYPALCAGGKARTEECYLTLFKDAKMAGGIGELSQPQVKLCCRLLQWVSVIWF